MVNTLKCVIVGSGVVLFGFFGGELEAQVNDYSTEGNLESTHDIGCASSDQLSNAHTPADLYRGLAACVEQRRYERGILLFALAGTYGRYDTLRVADRSAHQAVLALRMNHFDILGESKKQKFAEQLTRLLGDQAELELLCNEIKRIGAPTYFPRYMVQHGMDAVRGEVTNEGLIENFDADAAWSESLASYLHCPEPQVEKSDNPAPPPDGWRRR